MGAPVMLGDVLAGKYRVVRILGSGGMGVVVAARHLQLDQIVALKFLRPEALANPEALDRFASSGFAATLSQMVMGSPSYMSPEQMRSSKFVDGRTDVWALGIILHQLVVGHVPWKGETFVELCFKIAKDPLPRFPSAQPAGCEEVVRRCLEKEPKHRFAAVHALAVALLPFAPAHARPLVESIGRVHQAQAGRWDAGPTFVGRVLRGQAGKRDAMSTIPIGPSTLRAATGQSMEPTTTRSRQRRIIGLVAVTGVLAALVVAAVALGGSRGGEPAATPASSPGPDPAAAPPDPSPVLPPAGVAPSMPAVAKPEPLTTQEARPAATPPTKVEPPSPPPVAKSEPPTAHEPPPTTPPSAKVEPPPVSSTLAKPRGEERRRALLLPYGRDGR